MQRYTQLHHRRGAVSLPKLHTSHTRDANLQEYPYTRRCHTTYLKQVDTTIINEPSSNYPASAGPSMPNGPIDFRSPIEVGSISGRCRQCKRLEPANLRRQLPDCSRAHTEEPGRQNNGRPPDVTYA